MRIDTEQYRKLQNRVAVMEKSRDLWWHTWRELSDFFLPRRYPWLLTDKEHRSAQIRNRKILDSTSITALRTLSTGMMNGITSPARPWFRLRIAGFDEEELPHDAAVWLEEAARRMMQVMNESNFYNALGILYVEWPTFGTAAMGIYEDPDTVIRCRNYAVGEFAIDTDENNRVNRFSRKFQLTAEQAAGMFGIEALPETHQQNIKAGPPRSAQPVTIYHLVEPNDPDDGLVARSAEYRDLYWVAGHGEPELLSATPLREWRDIIPRWETYGTDRYGSSPCMDALPDVIQLQHLVKRRAQGLDKTVSPPMLVHHSLANRPKALDAGGVTYVSANDLSGGARPAFQIQIPFDEVRGEIQATQGRIQRVLFNDLFRMISELDTVRSATEIDARREEKLVLLGPVLQRFESEGLTPSIHRIFKICERQGVFPEPPPELEGAEINVQYVSIMSDAQRAVGTVSVERWLQLLGNVAQMAPQALDIPDWDELIREYADQIGVPKAMKRSREGVEAQRAQREQEQELAAAAEQGQQLASGAESLSRTEVGGGRNALQALLGD